MRKLKEHTKKFTIPPFNYTVVVIVSNDIHRSAEKRGIPGTEAGWVAMHCGTNAPLSLIFLPITAGVRTVSHESSHCAWRIMEILGAEKDDEIMAYTICHITGEIYKFLRKIRGNTMKKRTT